MQVCNSDTGKSLHWEDLEEGKGSFAYSCIFGRWLFQPGSFGQDGAVGLTSLCLWGQHFRINSPQHLRPSCIPSHCTSQSTTGEKHTAGTAEQPKPFAIPPLTRALSAAPSPENKGRAEEVTVRTSWWCQILLQNTWISL